MWPVHVINSTAILLFLDWGYLVDKLHTQSIESMVLCVLIMSCTPHMSCVLPMYGNNLPYLQCNGRTSAGQIRNTTPVESMAQEEKYQVSFL